METQITVRDEVTSRLSRPEFVFTLSLAAERLTVRELIRQRVYQEVETYNARLRELGQLEPPALPLVCGEAWADAAIADVEAETEDIRATWQQLLLHCQSAMGNQPSAPWLNGAQPALSRIGPDRFKAGVFVSNASVD